MKREAVKAFAFLLALAIEEAGLALSNAEALRRKLEHVLASSLMTVRDVRAWLL